MSQHHTLDQDVLYCARHPKETTAVRCASCGTPICTRCMVSTPVGMKCPDCARGKPTTLYQIRPERLLLAGLAAVIAGVGASIVGDIGFFAIFIATPYGYFAGMVILKASGMKRGIKLEMVAGSGMVAGALASMFYLGFGGLLDPFFWIAAVIATSAAVSKIRYL